MAAQAAAALPAAVELAKMAQQKQKEMEQKLASAVNAIVSPKGWENKKYALVLIFNNKTKTPVKLSEWVYLSGKELKSPGTVPKTGFLGEAFLCERDGSIGCGVSGSLKVTVGGSSKFIYFSCPFSGCLKIMHGTTRANCEANANDGGPKDCKVGNVTMYMKKVMYDRITKVNKNAEVFLVDFQ